MELTPLQAQKGDVKFEVEITVDASNQPVFKLKESVFKVEKRENYTQSGGSTKYLFEGWEEKNYPPSKITSIEDFEAYLLKKFGEPRIRPEPIR